LFWTIRIPDDSVEVDLDEAEASMKLSDVEIEDYHDLVNALKRGPSVHADVAFHVRWNGVTKRVHVRDEKNEFVGNFIENTATIEWSAETKNSNLLLIQRKHRKLSSPRLAANKMVSSSPDKDEDEDTD